MAYSFDLKELTKRMAGNVDTILRGAHPADIPFYQVSKFELSINLKARQGARARRAGNAIGYRRQGG